MAPRHVDQLEPASFRDWLQEGGAELLPLTATNEVIRYVLYKDRATGSGKAMGIVYRRKDGTLTWTGTSDYHYSLFAMGVSLREMLLEQAKFSVPSRQLAMATMAMRSKKTARKPPAPKIHSELRDRDGDDCFYCGLYVEPLSPVNKNDDNAASMEHLVARSQTGSDDPDGMVLAHRGCNNFMSDLPLFKKLKIRDMLRDFVREVGEGAFSLAGFIAWCTEKGVNPDGTPADVDTLGDRQAGGNRQSA